MILWNPAGQLDINTDAGDLPEESDGRNFQSDALVRCKNMHTDAQGKATTRYGSLSLNSTAIDSIQLLVEQGGDRYAFCGDVIYRNESSIATGLTDANWSAVKYNAYSDTTQQIYAINGTDRKRIEGGTVYEWGIEPPTSAPTAKAGPGTLTGAYSAKITYVGKVGTTVVRESDPSAATSSVTLSSNSLELELTMPTDPQVTHIRIYRTQSSGSLYYEDHDYTIPSLSNDYTYTYSWETAYIDSSLDGDLITTSTSPGYIYSWEADTTTATTIYLPLRMFSFEPHIAILDQSDAGLDSLVETDHDRPPLGTYVIGPVFSGYLFMVVDNLMYWCDAQKPEYWNPLNFIEVSPIQDPGIMMVIFNGQPYFLTKNEIYYIQGTGANTFFPIPMKAKAGAQGITGGWGISGHGIYHTGPDGIYMYANGNDVKTTHRTLEPIFRGQTIEVLPAISDMAVSWLFVADNKLYFGFNSSGYTYPYDIIVLNLETGKSYHYNYGVQIRCITYDETNQRILVGCNDGYVRVIEDETYTDDDGTAISWDIKSKEFTLPTRKHFPRWCKYDVDASSATSATGEIYLDGTLLQSHAITGNRQTQRRLIASDNGNREQIRIHGSGVATVYTVEAE